MINSFALSNGLEKSHVPYKYADYLFMLCFFFWGSFVCQLYFVWGGQLVLYESFIAALTYIYCKRFPAQQFKMMFMLQMKASEFPYFYAFFRVVTGRSTRNLLSGFLVGHVYYYLADVLPVVHKYRLLKPPKWACCY